jgi:hypothetical protein
LDAIALSMTNDASLYDFVKIYKVLGRDNIKRISEKMDWLYFISQIIVGVRNLELEVDDVKDALIYLTDDDLSYLRDLKTRLEQTFRVLQEIGNDYRILKNRYAIDSLGNKIENFIFVVQSTLQDLIKYMNYIS